MTHAACLHAGALACALAVVASAWAQDTRVPNASAGAPAAAPAAPPPAPAPGPAPAPAPDPNPAFRPGFIDAVGRWIGEGPPPLALPPPPAIPLPPPPAIALPPPPAIALPPPPAIALPPAPELPPLKSPQEVLGTIGSQATGAVKDAAGAAQQATGVIVGLPGTRIVTGRQRCPLAANGAPDCIPAAQALCRANGFEGGRGVDINSAQKCPATVWLSGRIPAEGECPTETFVTRAVCQ